MPATATRAVRATGVAGSIALAGKADKQRRLLDVAARHINAHGLKGVALDKIGAEIGLSRNALYHYVADRDDLIFQCFRLAGERMAEDLVVAAAASWDTRIQLRRFIEESLTFDSDERVALTDVEWLPAEKQRKVYDLLDANRASLEQIIRRGIAEGQLRAVDPLLAADLLLGSLSWARIAADWLSIENTRASRGRVIAALADLLLVGIAARPDVDYRRSWPLEKLMPADFDPFNSRQASQVKLEKIASTASRLFNRRGIDATSLDNIAEELGTTKGAIYHYFSSKDKLVEFCYARAYRIFETIMAAGEEWQGSGLGQIATTYHLHAQAQLGPISPLRASRGFFAMQASGRASIAQSSSRIIEISNRLYARGIADGSVRQVDALFTGSATAGAVLWLPAVLRSVDDMRQAAVVADAVTDILLHGIGIPPG